MSMFMPSRLAALCGMPLVVVEVVMSGWRVVVVVGVGFGVAGEWEAM